MLWFLPRLCVARARLPTYARQLQIKVIHHLMWRGCFCQEVAVLDPRDEAARIAQQFGDKNNTTVTLRRDAYKNRQFRRAVSDLLRSRYQLHLSTKRATDGSVIGVAVTQA